MEIFQQKKGRKWEKKINANNPKKKKTDTKKK